MSCDIEYPPNYRVTTFAPHATTIVHKSNMTSHLESLGVDTHTDTAHRFSKTVRENGHGWIAIDGGNALVEVEQ